MSTPGFEFPNWIPNRYILSCDMADGYQHASRGRFHLDGRLICLNLCNGLSALDMIADVLAPRCESPRCHVIAKVRHQDRDPGHRDPPCTSFSKVGIRGGR